MMWPSKLPSLDQGALSFCPGLVCEEITQLLLYLLVEATSDMYFWGRGRGGA